MSKQITYSYKICCKRLTSSCNKLGVHCSNLCTKFTEETCVNWNFFDDFGVKDERLENDVNFDLIISESNAPQLILNLLY